MAGKIDQLIINSPFERPAAHWTYERETQQFKLKEGRRPAGYVAATEDSQSFDDPGCKGRAKSAAVGGRIVQHL
ncbi:MAG: hypothetical protein BroJett014_32620 [Planctomycetota bacterium]|nr:hypothetical protein [Planctomycetota bacterium]GIK54289.1 MAG: hypothetical protein BroJett014_32620 [Planctomycetota bacterium]